MSDEMLRRMAEELASLRQRVSDVERIESPVSGGGGGGGGGSGNATQIQGRDVAVTAPDVGETLVWNGTAWAPAASGGGGGGSGDESVGSKLILFERYT